MKLDQYTLEVAAKMCEKRAEEISEWARKQKKLSGRDLALARSSRDSLLSMAGIIRGKDIWDTSNDIVATSVEADFEKGTWTFEPKGEWSVGAGDYYLIPVKK